MTCRITILCDNCVGPIAGTLGEHGFAALIESNGRSILFDTGQGSTLLHNAQRMNRNLHQVETVALSHGHYDHTGGLWSLLQSCGGKEVFAHPGVFTPRYRVREKGEFTSIGIPFTEPFLTGAGSRFNFSTEFRELGKGIYLTGEVPRMHSFEKGDTGLCCDSAGCVPDPLRDDQSLVIVGRQGLVLLLGCCHAGLVNTIELAREKTGVSDIHAVIGGTHLGFSSSAQLEETIAHLRHLKVKKIVGSHCTGFEASSRLAREFPSGYHPSAVGYTLEVQS